MTMLALAHWLRERHADTPDTPVHPSEVATEALSLTACTCDTSDTSSGDIALRNPAPLVSALPAHQVSSPRQNTAKISVDDRRIALFLLHGVTQTEACALSLRLERRDLEGDERSMCLECTHLSGTHGMWRCANWRVTGTRGSAIPGELVDLLQRCNAFVVRTEVSLANFFAADCAVANATKGNAYGDD